MNHSLNNLAFHLMRNIPVSRFGLKLLDFAGGLRKSKLPDGIRVETFSLKRRVGDERLTIYVLSPDSQNDILPSIIHFHGGGFAIGNPKYDFALISSIILSKSSVFILPSYQSSLNAPFPAALNDAILCLEWVILNSDNLKIDRTSINLAGISSGAGLATSLAIKANSLSNGQIKNLILISPMLDAKTNTSSHYDKQVYSWRPKINEFAWNLYLAGAQITTTRTFEFASPINADCLYVLPPVWGLIGQDDLFLDENLAFFDQLSQKHIQNTLVVVENAYHGVEILAPKSKVGRKFAKSIEELYIRVTS